MNSLRRRLQSEADGFTLVELVVVMLIAGVIGTIGVFSFVNYRNMSQERGSTSELISFLRSAAEQSVSEGRTYCVALANGTPATSNRSYSLWQKACTSAGGGTLTLSKTTQSTNVSFVASVTNPSPAPACSSGFTCLYFYPRGTALPASIVVSSRARQKLYTIRVEGLTARVYLA